MDNRCGKYLRFLRKRMGVSIEQVAVDTKISFDTLWRYEIGKQLPTFKNEETLCKYFNITLDDLHYTIPDA